MKCHKCGKSMVFVKGITFNEYKIGGWKCPCGEIYYEPEQAQKILLLNKLKKDAIRAKLGKIRSNLIVRLPKDLENEKLFLSKSKTTDLKLCLLNCKKLRNSGYFRH